MEVSDDPSCSGSHRFFVAETALVEAEGKVCVFMVCTACGKTEMQEFRVAEAHTGIRLGSEQSKNKKEL